MVSETQNLGTQKHKILGSALGARQLEQDNNSSPSFWATPHSPLLFLGSGGPAVFLG